MNTAHDSLVGNLRVFAMQDEREKNDVLVPILYLRSLLYFVSGVVEDEVDVPVLGMQRFLAEKPFQDPKFEQIQHVRDYLGAVANRGIWSIAEGVPGISSASIHHGDFDDDPATLASLVAILKSGY
jgi:hypothetical protein